MYRYVSDVDDIGEITELLHNAYAPLAAAGMRFTASYQGPETTRYRMSLGETIVAVEHNRIIGVITLRRADETHGSPFYDRSDVALFGQFAVRPSHQGRGVGVTLMNLVEQRAREQGVAELGLDTSEHAAGLIAFYQNHGYRFIEYIQWKETNYRSMI